MRHSTANNGAKAKKEESGYILSDRPAPRDLLDFKPYTDTLLDIIRDPNTNRFGNSIK